MNKTNNLHYQNCSWHALLCNLVLLYSNLLNSIFQIHIFIPKCFPAFIISVRIVLHRTCCCVVNIPGTCATPHLPPPQTLCRTWPRASWTPSPPCSSRAGSSCPSPPHCSSPSSPSCGTSRFISRETQTQGISRITGTLSSVPYSIDKLNIH